MSFSAFRHSTSVDDYRGTDARSARGHSPLDGVTTLKTRTGVPLREATSCGKVAVDGVGDCAAHSGSKRRTSDNARACLVVTGANTHSC